MKPNTSSQSGYVLLLTLIAGVVFLAVLMGISQLSFSNYTSARRALYTLSALSVAEGGADVAVMKLNAASNSGGSYQGTTSPVGNKCALETSSTTSANAVTLFNDSVRGKGIYETCIQDNTVINSNTNLSQNRYEKIIYSVAKIYQPSTATHPLKVERVKLIVEGSPSGDYSVQTGPGGLQMSNSASINNGNVYIGGFISMSNSAQIGTSSAPAKVYAANYNCPNTSPYTGYPQLCSSGNAITINNQAHIYGSVYANGQTNNSGMSNPGLVQTSGVAPTSLPDYDRAGQKSSVATTLSGNQSCSGSTTLILAANTKINGNLTLSNNCTVIVAGNIWITGNFSVSNNAVIKPDPSVATKPTIMVDGSSGVTLSNQASVANNATGIGMQFITFYAQSSCSPDCTSVTGSDLVNSMAISTINLSNQTLASGSSFYARWTALKLNNGGNIGSIMAQKIILSNSGSISFGNSVGSTTFSWSVRYYERRPVQDTTTTN